MLGRWANGKYERIQLAKDSGAVAESAGRSRSFYGLLEEPGGALLIGSRDGLYRWSGARLERSTAAQRGLEHRTVSPFGVL